MELNIKQIAEMANVSVATISRAISSETRSKVAAPTLKKIDRIIQRFGYTPNLAAQHLRKSSTKTIGVLFAYVPGLFYSYYYTQILAGISDYLLNTDYQFKLILLKEWEKQTWDSYDFKRGERVDGLIIIHWFKFFSGKSVMEKLNVPCVLVNDFDKDIQTQFVYSDHFHGGELAAENLYVQGHRRIGVLTGFSWSQDSKQRLEGFRSYLKKVGISLDADCIVRGDFLEHVAYQKIDELLKIRPKITAIFCCNDQMALGVLRRLKELKISCPRDISVVGFDNEPQTAYSLPPLTTIHMPVYDLGKEACQRLIICLKESNSLRPCVSQTLLPVKLMERQSVNKI